MARAAKNAWTIKQAMDSFALDHNGQYPNAQAAALHGFPPPETSNDLLRQLFAHGSIDDERLFWVEHSKVCNRRKPDNVTTTRGTFDPDQTLKPGDNHWAMIENQANTDNPSRPILVESPPTASGLNFDTEIWNLKSIVVRIDGSVSPNRLNPSSHLLDGDNKQLLTPDSAVWNGTSPSIAYPDPAKP